MSRIYFELTSAQGDRLGHLVRGVQLLRSHADATIVQGCSDVVDTTDLSGGAPALCCVVECESNAAEGALAQLCHETEWALGEDPAVLTVRFFRDGDPGTPMPALLQGLVTNQPANDLLPYAPSLDFAALCDWGQVGLG